MLRHAAWAVRGAEIGAITDVGASALAGALAGTARGGLRVVSSASAATAHHLLHPSTPQVALELRGNEIGEDGARALLGAMCHNGDLSRVDLSATLVTEQTLVRMLDEHAVTCLLYTSPSPRDS